VTATTPSRFSAFRQSLARAASRGKSRGADSWPAVILITVAYLIPIGLCMIPSVLVAASVYRWTTYREYVQVRCTIAEITTHQLSSGKSSGSKRRGGETASRMRRGSATPSGVTCNYTYEFHEKTYPGSTVDCYLGHALVYPKAYELLDSFLSRDGSFCFVDPTQPERSVLSKDYLPRYDLIVMAVVFGGVGFGFVLVQIDFVRTSLRRMRRNRRLAAANRSAE
jgi:hypothetical protein